MQDMKYMSNMYVFKHAHHMLSGFYIIYYHSHHVNHICVQKLMCAKNFARSASASSYLWTSNLSLEDHRYYDGYSTQDAGEKQYTCKFLEI